MTSFSRTCAIVTKEIFHDTARAQRVCAGCGRAGAFHAHHAVYVQHLRDRGLPLYHGMNALRLCLDCHARHHKRRQVLAVQRLLDDNLDYAFNVLGDYAVDYLAMYYDLSRADSRLEQQVA